MTDRVLLLLGWSTDSHECVTARHKEVYMCGCRCKSVCVCVCICVWVPLFVCVCVCMGVFVSVYGCLCMGKCVCMFACACARTCVCVCVCVYTINFQAPSLPGRCVCTRCKKPSVTIHPVRWHGAGLTSTSCGTQPARRWLVLLKQGYRGLRQERYDWSVSG